MHKSLASKYWTTRQVRWFLVVTLVGQLLIALWLHSYRSKLQPELASDATHIASYYFGGDAMIYIQLIENTLQDGYFYHTVKPGVRNYISKGPYYAGVYGLFRLFMPKSTALDAVIVFQIVFGVFALLLLGLLAEKYVDWKYGLPLVLGIGIVWLEWTHMGVRLTPDSLSLSLVICIAFLLDSEKLGMARWAVIGFLSAWLVGMKAYLAPLLLIIWLVGTYKMWCQPINWRNLLRSTFVFSSLVLVVLLPWTARTYINHDKLVFIRSLNASDHLQSAQDPFYLLQLSEERFLRAIGSSVVWWEPNSAACMFRYPQPKFPCRYEFPSSSTTSAYTKEDLTLLAATTVRAKATRDTLLARKLIQTFDSYTHSYRSERTLQYYFLGYMRIFKTFVLNSGSTYFNARPGYGLNSYIAFGMKLSASAIYWSLIILGLSGLFLVKKKNSQFWFLLSVPIYLIVFFVCIFKKPEIRYFSTGYGVFMISALALVNFIRLKFHTTMDQQFSKDHL